MSDLETYEIEICPDCVQAIANGEPHPDEGGEARLQAYEEGLGNGGYLAVGEGEAWFSHNRCDTCQGLPGDRYQGFEVYPNGTDGE